MSLLDARTIYKPFQYPWAYDAWLMQQRVHWLPEEVPLADDVKDWHRTLSNGERNLLTHIFRFFTQADVEVNNCYMKHYSQVFKPTEVQMMLAAFSNIETVHISEEASVDLTEPVGRRGLRNDVLDATPGPVFVPDIVSTFKDVGNPANLAFAVRQLQVWMANEHTREKEVAEGAHGITKAQGGRHRRWSVR